jgi:hypothetical protein
LRFHLPPQVFYDLTDEEFATVLDLLEESQNG